MRSTSICCLCAHNLLKTEYTDLGRPYYLLISNRCIKRMLSAMPFPLHSVCSLCSAATPVPQIPINITGMSTFSTVRNICAFLRKCLVIHLSLQKPSRPLIVACYQKLENPPEVAVRSSICSWNSRLTTFSMDEHLPCGRQPLGCC